MAECYENNNAMLFLKYQHILIILYMIKTMYNNKYNTLTHILNSEHLVKKREIGQTFPIFSFYNFLGVECFPTQIVLMVCLLSEYLDISCCNTENKTFNQLYSLNCKRKSLTSKIFSLLGYGVQLSSF